MDSFDCQASEPLIGIHPGATGGAAKRWIPEHYAEVADRLASAHRGRVVLLGGPGELNLTREIRSRIQAPVIDLAAKTSLVELMGALAALSVLVTNDSGPMHLAAALGTPTVAIFGPTDERETAPMGRNSRVLRRHVDCSPCLLKDCPTDHRCMTEVGVEEVLAAATPLLEKKYKSHAAEAAS